ncbi:family 78 glycoside hydrolase catalytic domain [Microbacterium sp. YY-01]|uniref:family 78 glycoside hydrolase catalytic domain n=1 Tax=Microbacterium sp. YY-01 TaxID=3421634 RepID=UPI003D1825FE
MLTPDVTLHDTALRVTALHSQHAHALLGVPHRDLRLTWQLVSDQPGTQQVAYQIARAEGRHTSAEQLHPEAPIASADQVAVPVGDLAPDSTHTFAVRAASSDGWSPWSTPLTIETAPTTLSATFIGIPSEVEGPTAVLRTTWTMPRMPQHARLRLTALGLVDAWINGTPATDALLTPGWTSYQGRILVDTIDVTHLLQEGENVIVLEVADGWYRGRMGFAFRTGIYGDQSGALAQIDTEDGTVLATDSSWRGSFGEVQAASIYDGTTIDYRRRLVGLHTPEFDDSGWHPVHVIDPGQPDSTVSSLLEPRSAPPIRVVAELPMTQTRADTTATDTANAVARVQFDAAQNITGWVRLRVRGTAGDRIVVRHAEVLEPSGDLHTAALRTAAATDTYILDSDGEHTLEPRFTFHGFQHAEVTGPVEVLSATAVAISSDLPTRSSFSSASAALDKFHSNVFWSQRDNFVSVPTDCPQRDERLGWTGDAQAFAPTANTLMHAEGFWRSWLRDLEVDQTDEGGVPSVVPDIIRFNDMHMGGVPVDNMGRAGWADAATIVPWAVYESTGSDEVLYQQLRSMRRWVTHLQRRAGTNTLLPTEPFQYGDWLDPDAPGERPWQAKVSSDFVANAFYVQSLRLLARAETVTGNTTRAEQAASEARRIAAAVWDQWRDEALRTQTGAALALEFEIAPEHERATVAAALADNVRAENGRIATGFLGTPLVLFALSNNGYLDEAYRMLLRREAPSWLYQVDRGATTVWERWDAILPDGSIHSGGMDAGAPDSEEGNMLSFNHYAYGAVIDWVYRTVAGLSPAQPGYRETRVAPRPAHGLDHAAAHIDTAYGRLAINWQLHPESATHPAALLTIDLDVPVGITATLDLPDTAASRVSVHTATPDAAEPAAPRRDATPASDATPITEAPAQLGSGRHRIVLTAPAVANPENAAATSCGVGGQHPEHSAL